MDKAREKHIEKIRKTEEALKTAGTIHKRDLFRHLIRLKRQLKQYDMFKGAG